MVFSDTSAFWIDLALLLTSALPGHAASVLPFKKKKEVPVGKKLTPAQSALIDKAVLREKEVIKVVRERAPLVETYIQNMRPDRSCARSRTPTSTSSAGLSSTAPSSATISTRRAPRPPKRGSKFGFFKNSAGFLGGLTSSLHLQFVPSGFTSMLLMDPRNFDKQHYNFYFVRSDFLGNTPTAVFDVVPSEKEKAPFFGRIWVETRNGNVVRFNGDFAGSDKTYREFFHFDSWRTNVQPESLAPHQHLCGRVRPQEPDQHPAVQGRQPYLGYVLKVPSRDAENTSLEVVGAQDVSQDAQDESPLGAQRAFAKQAEDNVVERLFQAGLQGCSKRVR